MPPDLSTALYTAGRRSAATGASDAEATEDNWENLDRNIN